MARRRNRTGAATVAAGAPETTDDKGAAEEVNSVAENVKGALAEPKKTEADIVDKENSPIVSDQAAESKPAADTTSTTNASSNETTVQNGSTGAPEGKKYELPEGLTKNQKRNFRARMRAKELKAKEAAGEITRTKLPADPLEDMRKAAFHKIKQSLQNLPRVQEMKLSDVLLKGPEQMETLETLKADCLEAIDTYVDKIKKPDIRKSSAQLLEQIQTLEKSDAKDEKTLTALKAQLVFIVSFENAREYRKQMDALMKSIDERIQQNKRTLNAARESDRRVRLAEKIHRLKLEAALAGVTDEGNDIVINPKDIVVKPADVTMECYRVISQGNISRRFEMLYTVSLERNSDARKRGVTIAGLESDVGDALLCLRTFDWSGRLKHKIDEPRLVSAFIGKGGVGVRGAEEQIGCFLTVREKEVIVYGTPEHLAEVQKHIQALASDPGRALGASAEVPLPHFAVAKSLQFDHKVTLNEWEKENDVTVRIASGGGNFVQQQQANSPSGANSPVKIAAFIRGRAQKDVDAVAVKLSELVGTLDFVELVDPTENRRGINRLMRQQNEPTNPSGRAPINDQRANIKSDFEILKQLHNLCYVRDGNSLYVVGPKEGVAKGAPVVADLLKKACYGTSIVAVARERSRCLTPENLGTLSAQCGVQIYPVRLRQTAENYVVEIWGDDESRLAAEKRLEEFLDEEGYVETLTTESDDLLQRLVENKAKKVQEIQSDEHVTISVDRKLKTIKITGNKQCVESAKKVVQDFEASLAEQMANLDTLVIDIDVSRIGALIGTRGARIQQIRNESKCRNVTIDDKSGTVTVVGDKAAVEAAKAMIVATAGLGQSSSSVNEPGSAPGRARGRGAGARDVRNTGETFGRGGAGSGRGGRRAEGAATGWVTGHKPQPTEFRGVGADDTTNFPTLDAAIAKGQGKRRKGRRGKATKIESADDMQAGENEREEDADAAEGSPSDDKLEAEPVDMDIPVSANPRHIQVTEVDGEPAESDAATAGDMAGTADDSLKVMDEDDFNDNEDNMNDYDNDHGDEEEGVDGMPANVVEDSRNCVKDDDIEAIPTTDDGATGSETADV